jgi:translation initiation factor 1
MSKKKKRLSFDAPPAALNNAFGSLPLDGLDLNDVPVTETPKSAEPKDRVPARLCLRRETAHRGGKAVVVVYDFPKDYPVKDIEHLASKLKQHCGCGGTTKNREIIIQGEKVPEVRTFLEKLGIHVRGV